MFVLEKKRIVKESEKLVVLAERCNGSEFYRKSLCLNDNDTIIAKDYFFEESEDECLILRSVRNQSASSSIKLSDSLSQLTEIEINEILGISM